VERKTLTLPRKKPLEDTPEKVALAARLGLRFVDREGRYILQVQASLPDRTWVDIPLVVERYA